MKYTKRSNTIGALNRGHDLNAIFSRGEIIVCPPQPKFDPSRPPPYMLGRFKSKQVPKTIITAGRFTLHFGKDVGEYLGLKDFALSSVSFWKFGISARVKITPKMRKGWGNEQANEK